MELTVQNAVHNSQNHQNMVSYTLNNINKIIANLEKSNRRKDDEGDPTLIQEHVSTLMTKFSDDSYDLSRDLSSIVDTFKGDRFDTQQLEHIVEHEQQRSRHILQLASFLDNQVNKLFIVMEGMFGHLDRGKKLPIGMKQSVSSKLSVVQETIDSMTKVMCSEPHDLQNVMDKAEKNIAIASEEAKTLDIILPPHDQESVPPPEIPAPVPKNLGLSEPSLESVSESSIDEAEEEENTGPSMWERLSAIRRNSGSKSIIPAVEEKPLMMDAECQTEVPEADTSLESPAEEALVEVEMELDEPWGTYDSSRNDSPRTSSRPGNNNTGSRNGKRTSSRNGRTPNVVDGIEEDDLTGTEYDSTETATPSGSSDPRVSARNNISSRPFSQPQKQFLDQQQNNNVDDNIKQKLYGGLNDDEIKLINSYREGMKQIKQQKGLSSQKLQKITADVDDFVAKALATETIAINSNIITNDVSGKQTKPLKGSKQSAAIVVDSKDSSGTTLKSKATAKATNKTSKSITPGSKGSVPVKTIKKKNVKASNSIVVDANSSSNTSSSIKAEDVEESENEDEEEEYDEKNVMNSSNRDNNYSNRRLSLAQVAAEVIATNIIQQNENDADDFKQRIGEKADEVAAKGLGVLHHVDASDDDDDGVGLEAMTGNSQLGNYQLDLQDFEEDIIAGENGLGSYHRSRRSNSMLLSRKNVKIDLELNNADEEIVIERVMNLNDDDGGNELLVTATDIDESVVSSVELDSFQSDDEISIESEEPPDSDGDDVLQMSADSAALFLSGKQSSSKKDELSSDATPEDPFYSPLTDGMMNVKSYPIVHHPSPETLRRMSQTKSHSHLKTIDNIRSRQGSFVRKTSSAGSHNRHHYSMQVEMAAKGTTTEDLLVYDTGSPLFRPMLESRMKIGGNANNAISNAPSLLAPIDDKLVSRSLDSRQLLQPRRRNSAGGITAPPSSSSSSSSQTALKSSKLKKGTNIINNVLSTSLAGSENKSSMKSPTHSEDEYEERKYDQHNSNNNSNHHNNKSSSSKKSGSSDKNANKMFDEQLKASVNPLLEIYNKYHASLPESWKAQLLTASTGGISDATMMVMPSVSQSMNTLSEQLQKMNNDNVYVKNASTDDIDAVTAAAVMMNEMKLVNIKKQFASSIHVLENLKLTATNNLIRLGKCERLTSELLNLMNDGAADANLYQEKLETLFRKLGVLDASKMFVEIQLAHYRGMFTEIQAISESAFPTMMRDVAELRTSYKLFISTQGKIVRLGRRVKALKTYCVTVQLLSPHTNASLKLDSHRTHASVDRTEMDYYVFDEIQRLEAELETSRHRNNQLNEELYHMTHRADNSPGALSFYSTLTDPSLIPSLKALAEDLIVLKDFSNLSEHIDFATLRISLKKCVTAVPYLERFIQKFNTLYKRWTKRRLEMYCLRNRDGVVSDSNEGVEDGSDSCPICCSDRRSSNDVEFQKELKKNMLLQKIMNVTRSSIASSPTKGPLTTNTSNNNSNSGIGIIDNNNLHLNSSSISSSQMLSLSQSLPTLTVLPPLSHRQHQQQRL